MMTTLTVYTPTFNRARLLPRVYSSLCKQSCKNFIWLIIDDGSTDDTRDLVYSWINDSIITIKYVYKENGGVHTARDLAYSICTTELITSCDSDDWYTEDAVELIVTFWEKNGSSDYSGIFFSTKDAFGHRVCSVFPKIKEASYQEFTFKYRCIGDKHTVLRTEVIKKIPKSPVFPKEKIVAEAYKWIQIPEDKPFLLCDIPIYVVEYQNDGISNNVACQRFENPYGFRETQKMYIIYGRFNKIKLKGFLCYIAYSIIVRDKNYIFNSPKPLTTFLLTPFGVVVYFYFLFRMIKVKNGRKKQRAHLSLK